MAKPRTNAQAVTYWAESILEREPRERIEVNSIIVTRDVVYSFGHHYPMGVIQRRADGTVKRVIVNTDTYPARGWANTPGDQWNVKADAREYAARAKVPVVSQRLSAYGTGGRIQCRPKAHDPEPEEFPRCIVPPYFFAAEPGNEPVQDRSNCIAGRVEVYEYQDDNYMLSNLELYADDQAYAGTERGYGVTPGLWLFRKYGSSGTGGSIYSRTMHVGTIVYGEVEYEYQHFTHGVKKPRNVTYKQCPCCKEFRERHRLWTVEMHGGWHPSSCRRVKGWLAYEALMFEHGGEEGWRQARREDLRRVRRAKKDRAEWEERNFMSFDRVPKKNGIPVLDADGYPLRKDSEAHFAAKRAAERANRRHLRELAKRERERLQVEKFKERVERNRARRRECSFEGTAQRVADTLAQLRSVTEELESSS